MIVAHVMHIIEIRNTDRVPVEHGMPLIQCTLHIFLARSLKAHSIMITFSQRSKLANSCTQADEPHDVSIREIAHMFVVHALSHASSSDTR
jgi:hypothetical protein